MSEIVEVLKKLAGEMKSPALIVYALLVERRHGRVGVPGISQAKLLELTGLSTRTLEQTLEWLEQHGLISELQAVTQRYFFAES